MKGHDFVNLLKYKFYIIYDDINISAAVNQQCCSLNFIFRVFEVGQNFFPSVLSHRHVSFILHFKISEFLI
jgi:hypothetical protein